MPCSLLRFRTFRVWPLWQDTLPVAWNRIPANCTHLRLCHEGRHSHLREDPQTDSRAQGTAQKRRSKIDGTSVARWSHHKDLPQEGCSACEAKKLRRQGALPVTLIPHFPFWPTTEGFVTSTVTQSPWIPWSVTSATFTLTLSHWIPWRHGPIRHSNRPDYFDLDLTKLTSYHWRRPERRASFCTHMMLYLVQSCSMITPIWKREGGSSSQNSRCDWNHQRLLWIIPWSLAHSSWASNDTGGRSCFHLSWPDIWINMASRREPLDWLEEKNLDVWMRPTTIRDLVWSPWTFPVHDNIAQPNAEERESAFLFSLSWSNPRSELYEWLCRIFWVLEDGNYRRHYWSLSYEMASENPSWTFRGSPFIYCLG